MAAVGGAVWTIGDSGRLKLQYQVNLARDRRGRTPQARTRHGLLLIKSVWRHAGDPRPARRGRQRREAGNPTTCLLVLAPLIVEKEPMAVVEIFQRPAAGRARSGATCGSSCRCATWPATISRAAACGSSPRTRRCGDSSKQLVQALHRSLDVQADRLCRRQRRPADDRLRPRLAGAGLRRPVPRSKRSAAWTRSTAGPAEVQRLAQLATAVLRTGEPLWSEARARRAAAADRAAAAGVCRSVARPAGGRAAAGAGRQRRRIAASNATESIPCSDRSGR